MSRKATRAHDNGLKKDTMSTDWQWITCKNSVTVGGENSMSEGGMKGRNVEEMEPSRPSIMQPGTATLQSHVRHGTSLPNCASSSNKRARVTEPFATSDPFTQSTVACSLSETGSKQHPQEAPSLRDTCSQDEKPRLGLESRRCPSRPRRRDPRLHFTIATLVAFFCAHAQATLVSFITPVNGPPTGTMLTVIFVCVCGCFFLFWMSVSLCCFSGMAQRYAHCSMKACVCMYLCVFIHLYWHSL